MGHDTGLLDGLEGVLAAGQEKDVGPGLDDKTRIMVWDLELGIRNYLRKKDCSSLEKKTVRWRGGQQGKSNRANA